MSATAAKGQAMWIASAAEDTGAILLGVRQSNKFSASTMISCPTQIEQSVIWPALRASKTKKKNEYNFYPSMQLPKNRRKTVKDEEIFAGSISFLSTSSQSQPCPPKPKPMHAVDKSSLRTPTPPRKSTPRKKTVFQLRQNRTVLQETESEDVSQPPIRRSVKNRAQMCHEYKTGISKLLSVRPSSPLQGWLGTDSGEECRHGML